MFWVLRQTDNSLLSSYNKDHCYRNRHYHRQASLHWHSVRFVRDWTSHIICLKTDGPQDVAVIHICLNIFTYMLPSKYHGHCMLDQSDLKTNKDVCCRYPYSYVLATTAFLTCNLLGSLLSAPLTRSFLLSLLPNMISKRFPPPHPHS